MTLEITGPACLTHGPTRNILGIEVHFLTWNEAIGTLRRLVVEKRFTRVGFLNAHNSNIARHHRQYADDLQGFMVLPDGIGVDIAAKMLYGAAFPDNLNGTDLIPALLQAVPRKLTVGIIGARMSSALGAANVLKEIAPLHDYFVAGDGFYRPEEEAAILDSIRERRPDILLVALGVPRQELWISQHITPDFCTMPIAVGALVDFLSGVQPRAPHLWRKFRMEWLYRLFSNPRRLWRRYLVGNPVFLWRVLQQKLSA